MMAALAALGLAVLSAGSAHAHPPALVNTTDPEVVAAAHFVAEGLANETGANVSVHSVVEAQQQLVNGMNYDVVLLLDTEQASLPEGVPHAKLDLVQARVYKRPPWMMSDGSGSPYELSSRKEGDVTQGNSGELQGDRVDFSKTCTGGLGSVEVAQDFWAQSVEAEYTRLDGPSSSATYTLLTFIVQQDNHRNLVCVLETESEQGTSHSCQATRVLPSAQGGQLGAVGGEASGWAEDPAEQSRGAVATSLGLFILVTAALVAVALAGYFGWKSFRTRRGEREYTRQLEMDDL